MKISKFTISALDNFTNINSGIVIKKNNIKGTQTEIRTVAPDQSMQAIVVIDEVFDNDVCIYDLKPLLNVIRMADEPELTFGTDQVSIKGDGFNTKMTYAQDNEIVHEYDRTPKLKGDVIEFDISDENLKKILKFADILQLSNIKFDTNENNDIIISAFDRKNPDSKTSEFVVGKADENLSSDFFPKVYDRSKFKLIDGDYHVSISEQGLAQFTNLTHTKNSIQYFLISLALDV